MSNFKLAILELYLPSIHGNLAVKQQYLYGHYLILQPININKFYDNINIIKKELKYVTQYYTEFINKLNNTEYNNSSAHPLIRNYKNIVENPKHLELKIIKPIDIKFGPGLWDYYSTGIDKTFWIRLIQRRWRNIQKKRIQSKTNINNLKYKEMNGRWPEECHIPFRLGIK